MFPVVFSVLVCISASRFLHAFSNCISKAQAACRSHLMWAARLCAGSWPWMARHSALAKIADPSLSLFFSIQMSNPISLCSRMALILAACCDCARKGRAEIHNPKLFKTITSFTTPFQKLGYSAAAFSCSSCSVLFSFCVGVCHCNLPGRRSPGSRCCGGVSISEPPTRDRSSTVWSLFGANFHAEKEFILQLTVSTSIQTTIIFIYIYIYHILSISTIAQQCPTYLTTSKPRKPCHGERVRAAGDGEPDPHLKATQVRVPEEHRGQQDRHLSFCHVLYILSHLIISCHILPYLAISYQSGIQILMPFTFGLSWFISKKINKWNELAKLPPYLSFIRSDLIGFQIAPGFSLQQTAQIVRPGDVQTF